MGRIDNNIEQFNYLCSRVKTQRIMTNC